MRHVEELLAPVLAVFETETRRIDEAIDEMQALLKVTERAREKSRRAAARRAARPPAPGRAERLVARLTARAAAEAASRAAARRRRKAARKAAADHVETRTVKGRAEATKPAKPVRKRRRRLATTGSVKRTPAGAPPVHEAPAHRELPAQVVPEVSVREQEEPARDEAGATAAQDLALPRDEVVTSDDVETQPLAGDGTAEGDTPREP
jgi:hypothetical protein